MTTPPRNPTANNHRLQSDPNPDTHPITTAVAPSPHDEYLSRATHLTRPELIRRRAHNLRQLSRCYRDYYWVLMEELKAQHRDYYWTFGASPFKEGGAQVEEEGVGENGKCMASGCKSKAMALTSFCLLHILLDKHQNLYRPCGYLIKRDILCGKAILRSTSPPLCGSHFQRAQSLVLKALKKAGLNVSPSNKLAPKLHVVVAEYVRQIQSKRRAAKSANPGTTA